MGLVRGILHGIVHGIVRGIVGGQDPDFPVDGEGILTEETPPSFVLLSEDGSYILITEA